MSSPDAGLVAAILANATVISLVGTRVYHGERPQTSILPAIAWKRSGVQREMLLDGPSGMATAYYELEVIAETSAQSRTIADAVRSAVHGVTGNLGGATVRLAMVTTELDVSDVDGDLKVRHVLMDIEIIFPE